MNELLFFLQSLNCFRSSNILTYALLEQRIPNGISQVLNIRFEMRCTQTNEKKRIHFIWKQRYSFRWKSVLKEMR